MTTNNISGTFAFPPVDFLKAKVPKACKCVLCTAKAVVYYDCVLNIVPCCMDCVWLLYGRVNVQRVQRRVLAILDAEPPDDLDTRPPSTFGESQRELVAGMAINIARHEHIPFNKQAIFDFVVRPVDLCYLCYGDTARICPYDWDEGYTKGNLVWTCYSCSEVAYRKGVGRIAKHVTRIADRVRRRPVVLAWGS